MSNELMANLLKPAPGESILDIGCGTGGATEHMLQMGLNTTGVDPSPYMLQLCADHFGQRVDLYRGFAEELPFDDNSFNHAVFLISLEFVNDPVKAVEEACRVAKDRVFFGFLNRFALKGVQRWRKAFWNAQVFQNARLFTVWELKKMVRSVAGPVPIQWRTVCQLPQSSGKVFRNIENFDILQRCPFGAFAGMVVTLVPRFRTRPLAIRYKPEKRRSVIPKSVVPAGPSGMDSHGGHPCKPTFSNPLGSRRCSVTFATTAAPSNPAAEDCAA